MLENEESKLKNEKSKIIGRNIAAASVTNEIKSENNIDKSDAIPAFTACVSVTQLKFACFIPSYIPICAEIKVYSSGRSSINIAYPTLALYITIAIIDVMNVTGAHI